MGNSLGFTPGPLTDLTSSSQLALVVPQNSPDISAPEPPPMHPPPTPSPTKDPIVHLGNSLGQPHSFSYFSSCTKFQDGLEILQDLVFVVRKDVDNICFCLELLEKRGTQIIQMISTLQGPRYSPDQASNAPTTSTVVLALVLQTLAADNSTEVLASTLHAPTMDNLASNRPFAWSTTPT